MEKLRKIMGEIRPDLDFDTSFKLIDEGILDSFDIISMVSEINNAFDIEINVDDLTPENFNSMIALSQLIEKLKTN